VRRLARQCEEKEEGQCLLAGIGNNYGSRPGPQLMAAATPCGPARTWHVCLPRRAIADKQCPAPFAGATVYVRLLNGTSPDQFKPTTRLLARSWTLK